MSPVLVKKGKFMYGQPPAERFSGRAAIAFTCSEEISPLENNTVMYADTLYKGAMVSFPIVRDIVDRGRQVFRKCVRSDGTLVSLY